MAEDLAFLSATVDEADQCAAGKLMVESQRLGGIFACD